MAAQPAELGLRLLRQGWDGLALTDGPAAGQAPATPRLGVAELLASLRRHGTALLHPRHRAQIIAKAEDVDHLPAGHALRTRSAGEATDQLGPDLGVVVGVRVRHDLEGDGLERVAYENGGRLVIGLVHGRAAAADVVVVHRGQVVVHEAVGVDALQRAGGAENGPFFHVEQLGRFQGEVGT